MNCELWTLEADDNPLEMPKLICSRGLIQRSVTRQMTWENITATIVRYMHLEAGGFGEARWATGCCSPIPELSTCHTKLCEWEIAEIQVTMAIDNLAYSAIVSYFLIKFRELFYRNVELCHLRVKGMQHFDWHNC